MGQSQSSGFFGIICKICLCIHVGMIADDFNGLFVGTYRTIRTKSPEFTGDSSFGGGVWYLSSFKGSIGYIICDTNGKMVLWILLFQIVKYTGNVVRSGIFRTQTKSSAYNNGCMLPPIETISHILI